jgi:hypothetical protein
MENLAPYYVVAGVLAFLQIIGILISAAGFMLIKFNDLKHLAIDVKDLMKQQDITHKKVTKIELKQATMSAVCAERHGRRK